MSKGEFEGLLTHISSRERSLDLDAVQQAYNRLLLCILDAAQDLGANRSEVRTADLLRAHSAPWPDPNETSAPTE